MEEDNYFQNQSQEDPYVMTEESVNLSNTAKYLEQIDNSFLEDKENILVKDLNLISKYKYEVIKDRANKINGESFKNIKTQQKNAINYNFLEKTLKNFSIYQNHRETMRSRNYPYSNLNMNAKKIVPSADFFKINLEDYSRASRFTMEEEVKRRADLFTKVDDAASKILKNHSLEIDKKINIFNFAPLLKIEEYLSFITISIIIKHHQDDENRGYLSTRYHKEMYASENFKKEVNLFEKEIKLDSVLNTFNLKNVVLGHKQIYHGQAFINDVVNIWGKKLTGNSKNYLFELIKYTYLKKTQGFKLYTKWKLLLGRLVTVWDFKNSSGINTKLRISYLKTKFVLIKLFKNKERGDIFYFKEKLNDFGLKEHFLAMDMYCRFILIKENWLSILYDFVIDLSLIYFFLILPLILVLKISSSLMNFIDQVFHMCYFFNILRVFRTLARGDKNEVKTELNVPFMRNIKSLLLYIDIISLIPFDILVISGNPDDYPISYSICRFLVMLRIFRFGASFRFLESTKYATIFRLMKLMGSFILLVYWCGLFFLIVFEKSITSEIKQFYDQSCNTYDPLQPYLSYCMSISAFYIGGFIVPGKSVEKIKTLEGFKTAIQYYYLFGVFFLGQIITAYVFSSVSDVIQNMNQAENAYQEILDNHRLTGIFYDFEKTTIADIQMFYNYLWNKHREKIYGMQIFQDLSESLRKDLRKAMFPSYKYLLKDFFFVNTKNNNFISFIINNITKYTAFPYERLITQGQVIKGLFILSNGTVYFEDEPRIIEKKIQIKNTSEMQDNKIRDAEGKENNFKNSNRKDLLGEITINKKIINEKLDYIENNKIKKIIDDTVAFPWDSMFLKTGRAIQTYYVKNFVDLFIIETNFIDEIIMNNYPNEMFYLSQKAKHIGMIKLGNDHELFSIIKKRSSRSTGRYYEENFTLDNIWIEIKTLLPKYKLKTMTLVNKLDIITNVSESHGLFENSEIMASSMKIM
jgi:hypothetical protein